MSKEKILQFKRANCRNCYKCVRNCPVKAITVQEQQAQILEHQCILCEKCTLVCPQNAKKETNHIEEINALIAQGKQVIVTVHRTYLARYGERSFSRIKEVLQQLGFSDAIETGDGFERMRKAYQRHMKSHVWITSMCPVIVRLIEKQYPEMIPNLLPVLSPTQSHAQMLKAQYPDAVVVSLSPCISSMAEEMEPVHFTDYVLTYQQLEEWLAEKQLKITNDGHLPATFNAEAAKALNYGIGDLLELPEGMEFIRGDSMDTCRMVLDEIHRGGYHDCLVELVACPGGCLGGPSFGARPKVMRSLLRVRQACRDSKELMETSPEIVEQQKAKLQKIEASCPPLPERIFSSRPDTSFAYPSEEQIRKILHAMGKDKPEDELDCSACGYDTCRAKAVAVAQKKAEITMCVPFMLSRSENYSNKIINAMSGMLVTTDYHLKIVHMNKAAIETFAMNGQTKLVGGPVSAIMDDYELANLISFDVNAHQDEFELEVHGKKRIIRRTLTNDRKNELILCVLNDITKQREEERQLEMARREAAAMADKMAADQMRMVHQIAGLLGETAASTKVAVEQLKQTIQPKKEADKTNPPFGK